MNKVIDKSLLSNILSLLVYRGTMYIFPLITLPYLARVLGVEKMGLLAIAVACIQYCITISDWGFNINTTKDIAQNRGNKPAVTQIFWSTFNAKLILGLITVGILLMITWAMPKWHTLFYIISASSLTLFAQMFSFSWLFQGYERLGKFSVMSSIGQAASVPLTFLFVRSAEDVWLAALIPGLTSLVTAVIAIFFIIKMQVIGRYSFSASTSLLRLKEGFQIFLSVASANLFNNVNILLLASFAGPYAVGLYNGADRLKKAANALPEQIGNAFFPRVSALFVTDKKAAIASTKKSILFSFSMSLFIVVFTEIFADLIVKILLGPDFISAANVLRVSVLCFLFGNVAYPIGLQVLIPHGLAKERTSILFIVGIINLPFCAFLSYYYGALGAASALLLSELLVFIGVIMLMSSKNLLHIYFRKIN